MSHNSALRMLSVLLMAAVLAAPATVASAANPITPPPLAITGPRLIPPIPLPSYDLLVNAPLTINALEADAADGGRRQEAPGRGCGPAASDQVPEDRCVNDSDSETTCER